MKLWGIKMSKLVELTENDIKYLKELDLNLFKKSEMYFDYDLIMSMIEMTPAEIYDMEDGYNYRVISWFDDLLFTELEAFNGEDFVNELTGGKDTIKKRCPLNNKKSKEYEEYVTLKKVFAYSLKGIIEGKSDALDREYINGIMINDDAPSEVKEFQEGLNKLTNGKSQEVGEYSDLIHLDDAVVMYERVWDDKEKPKIKDGTKLVDIIDVIILATHGEVLDDYQKEIGKEKFVYRKESFDEIVSKVKPAYNGVIHIDDFDSSHEYFIIYKNNFISSNELCKLISLYELFDYYG